MERSKSSGGVVVEHDGAGAQADILQIRCISDCSDSQVKDLDRRHIARVVGIRIRETAGHVPCVARVVGKIQLDSGRVAAGHLSIRRDVLDKLRSRCIVPDRNIHSVIACADILVLEIDLDMVSWSYRAVVGRVADVGPDLCSYALQQCREE